MVTPEGRVIEFFSGLHPMVRDGLPVLAESGAMQFEQGPALVDLGIPNVRDAFNEAGLTLLREEEELRRAQRDT
jgi:hypothetical protein